MKYRLVHYFDVWGNRKEGYEVNNQCEHAIVEFTDYPSNDEILNKLKKINFLKKTTRKNSFNFDNQGENIEIETHEGRPICGLHTLEYEIEKYGQEAYESYHLEYGRKIFD